jgi:NAD-dependent SIR2 family protein deacetylase
MENNATNFLFNILTDEDRAILQKNFGSTLGPYQPWGGTQPVRSCKLEFELDARPLATLIDAAACGDRIYELMSITRPGDILHYLWMKIIAADKDVITSLKDHLVYEHHFGSKIDKMLSELPFLAFDKAFNWMPCVTDEEPFSCMWYFYRQGQSFPSVFDVVKRTQQNLRQQKDYLLEKEIARIDAHTHAHDLLPSVKRYPDIALDEKHSKPIHMPKEVFDLVAKLIQQDDVNSVYCYAKDYIFWRMVVAEQVKRAESLALPPQEALNLCGTDSGFVDEWATAWGGEIAIPYEGCRPADLFILPGWYNFNYAHGCYANEFWLRLCQQRGHYVLSPRDFGEIECTTRTEIGSWVLYKSKAPYHPVRDEEYTRKLIENWEEKRKAEAEKLSVRNNLKIPRAAELIAQCDGLIITAGAGMGVDSGLPDFRGKHGFWRAYPYLASLNITFQDIANPEAFVKNPKRAWGFYGQRLALYRKTNPHKGFLYLRAMTKHLKGGAFVFTSNVDGHFQKAGFREDKIVECHGSIHHMQCQNTCDQQIWDATEFKPQYSEHLELNSDFECPVCPTCGGVARPNILMFGDWYWIERRTQLQMARFHEWRYTVKNPVIIEIGAGKAIPTVREFGEDFEVPLIRINPVDAEVTRSGDVSLQMGALEGIKAIAQKLVDMGFVKKND